MMTRREYFEELCELNPQIDRELILNAMLTLGPSEDRDGLISVIEDFTGERIEVPELD